VQSLHRYDERLSREGGRLFLSGVEPELVDAFARIGGAQAIGPVELVPARHVLGEASLEAHRRAQEWVTQGGTP
jgi:hypothetical protein